MKISEKQLMMLLDIAKESLAIVNPMPYDQETRSKLVDQILNQQDDRLKDISKLKSK